MFAMTGELMMWMRAALQRWAPSNRLARWTRRRRNLAWAPLAAAAASAGCFAALWLVMTAVQAGATRWLYLLAIVLVWDAIKFAWLVLFSLLRLLVAAVRERAVLVRSIRAWRQEAREAGLVFEPVGTAERKELLRTLRETADQG